MIKEIVMEQWVKGRGMNDQRNRHGAVGKSSLEQHFHKSAAITFIV